MKMFFRCNSILSVEQLKEVSYQFSKVKTLFSSHKENDKQVF